MPTVQSTPFRKVYRHKLFLKLFRQIARLYSKRYSPRYKKWDINYPLFNAIADHASIDWHPLYILCDHSPVKTMVCFLTEILKSRSSMSCLITIYYVFECDYQIFDDHPQLYLEYNKLLALTFQ